MGLEVPLAEIRFDFARSSGAGGQNVNKVETKAVLRWSVVRSAALSEARKRRFLERFGNRVTKEGDLVLASQRFRDRSRNIADCVEKLREMLGAIADPPKPRRKTKPSRSARERRLREKKMRSETKRTRRELD